MGYSSRSCVSGKVCAPCSPLPIAKSLTDGRLECESVEQHSVPENMLSVGHQCWICTHLAGGWLSTASPLVGDGCAWHQGLTGWSHPTVAVSARGVEHDGSSPGWCISVLTCAVLFLQSPTKAVYNARHWNHPEWEELPGPPVVKPQNVTVSKLAVFTLCFLVRYTS